MLLRMAPSCLALSSTLLLLAVAGSVSAQDPCLGSGPDLLYYSCLSYLTLDSEPSPDATCCSEVVSLTTNYGPGCLCEVIQFDEANPNSYESQSIIPGRLYNLNGDCSAHADMTNCSGSSPPPAGGVPPPPPASVTAPPGLGSTTPPGVETPTLGETSPPASGSNASTGALVGGSVGGVSVFGVIVFIIFKCLQNFEIKWDLNAPCWCCQRRSEKPHPSHGGTEGVHHPASYPPHYTTPYRAPYPVHFNSSEAGLAFDQMNS